MNHDFANGLSGWTVLVDAGSNSRGLLTGLCYSEFTTPDEVPCLVDALGTDYPGGSYVLVSSAHTVLPGEALSAAISVIFIAFTTYNLPDTMHYLPNPPNPVRSQVRLDVYDAGNPAYSSAASLQASVFNATDIEAAPYLGSLLGVGFTNLPSGVFTTKSFSLAPYVGKSVYFAYRTSNNADFAWDRIESTNYTISC